MINQSTEALTGVCYWFIAYYLFKQWMLISRCRRSYNTQSGADKFNTALTLICLQPLVCCRTDNFQKLAFSAYIYINSYLLFHKCCFSSVLLIKLTPLITVVWNWRKSQKLSCCDWENLVLVHITRKKMLFREILHLIVKFWF